MNAFLYGVILQWKLGIRNRNIFLIYYIVPLVFFGFMGGIFIALDPLAKTTLIQSMTIFAVTMGAFLGSPLPLVELYGSDIKNAYKVGGIPLIVGVINNLISGFIHLFIVSLIIFFIAPLFFNATVPDNLLLYFIVLVIFILTCLLIGSVLGLLIKDTSKVTMLSQLLFLPSIMLSGIMFPTTMLPDSMAHIGKLLPATWAYTNMIKDNFTDLTFFQPSLIIIITVIMISLKIRRLEKI